MHTIHRFFGHRLVIACRYTAQYQHTPFVWTNHIMTLKLPCVHPSIPCVWDLWLTWGGVESTTPMENPLQSVWSKFVFYTEEREKNAIYSGHLYFCLQPMGTGLTPLGPILQISSCCVMLIFCTKYHLSSVIFNDFDKVWAYCSDPKASLEQKTGGKISLSLVHFDKYLSN